MLLKMYKKSQNKQNGNSSDKELIDISSDDDVSKSESNATKTNEPEATEKSVQQKPGTSSSIEQPAPTNEVERLKTVSSKVHIHVYIDILALTITIFIARKESTTKYNSENSRQCYNSLNGNRTTY